MRPTQQPSRGPAEGTPRTPRWRQSVSVGNRLGLIRLEAGVETPWEGRELRSYLSFAGHVRRNLNRGPLSPLPRVLRLPTSLCSPGRAASLECAALGLPPTPREGIAALVPARLRRCAFEPYAQTVSFLLKLTLKLRFRRS